MKCIYCRRDKPINEFSIEHIFPQSLGGNFLPKLFQSDKVCKRCNELFGLFVDGMFLKSFFIKSDYFNQSIKFIDFEKFTPVPLLYLGVLKNDFLKLNDNEICELWISPCRGRILHIHKNFDEKKFLGYAGGDPIKYKKNPGIAIFINSSTNQIWTNIGLNSFVKHFKLAKRYVANINFGNKNLFDYYGLKPNQSVRKIIENYMNIVKYDNNAHKMSNSFNIDFDQRFLAKLALGIGYNLFGDSYIESDYANLLREAIFEIDNEKRNKLKILTNSYFTNNKLHEISKKYLMFDDGIALTFKVISNWYVLFLAIGDTILFSGISDDNKFWDKENQINDSLYVLIPQRQYSFGPIETSDYIQYREGSILIPELEIIKSWKKEINELPPREI